MKKYFTFGLIMSLVSGACFAEHPMITQLIREKQQKMEKLEKCKGTTKNLKIAGISTLGITAVGVGANIAEAVVLSNTKEDVKKAKVARDAQLEIKGNRQEFIEMCNEIGGQLLNNQKECYKLCFEESEYNTLLSLIQQEADISCKIITNTITEKKTSCVDKDKHLLSLQLTPRNGQSQGDKEQGSGQGVAQNSAGTKQEQTPADSAKPDDSKKSGNKDGGVNPAPSVSCDKGFWYDTSIKKCVEDSALKVIAEHNDLQTGHSCPDGKKWDDTQYKCVDPAQVSQVSCNSGYTYDVKTKMCVQDQDVFPVQEESHECLDGAIWSAESGGCVSILPDAQSVQTEDVFGAQ